MYEIFKALLEKKGLRAIDVTNATGIKATTLSEWKSGKSKPNTEKMIKIAHFLGVSVEYLVTGEDVKGKEYFLNDETVEIAKAIYENKTLYETFKLLLNLDEKSLTSIMPILQVLNN